MSKLTYLSVLLVGWALAEVDLYPVATLTPDNYTAFLGSAPATLVWVGDQNDFNGDTAFKHAIEAASGSSYPVQFGFIDFRKHRSFLDATEPLADSPCFLFHNRDGATRYEGDLAKFPLADWLNTELFSIDALQLTSLQQIAAVKQLKFAVLLALEPGNLEQMRQFKIAIQHEPATRFYFTYLSEAKHLFTNTTTRTVLNVIRNFEDGPKCLSTDAVLSEERIREFSGMFRQPSIRPFDRLFVDSMFQGNTTAFIWFRPSHVSRFWEEFSRFAFENRHQIDIYTCAMSEQLCQSVAMMLGHSDNSTDGVFVVQNSDEGFKKYRLRAPVLRETIDAFLKNFLDGFLGAFVKSEPEPAIGQDLGVLKKVVRASVNRNVFKPDKDVVLYVYSEESGDWRDQQTVLEGIALSYMGDDSVSFCRYDFGRNEHDHIYVTKVPSLVVFPRKAKSAPKIYQGEFERAGILDFLLAVLENRAATEAAMEEVETEGEF